LPVAEGAEGTLDLGKRCEVIKALRLQQEIPVPEKAWDSIVNDSKKLRIPLPDLDLHFGHELLNRLKSNGALKFHEYYAAHSLGNCPTPMQ